jgi:tetratricopeptide (TPR) repeat protein
MFRLSALAALGLAIGMALAPAHAQDPSLLPKYGQAPKTEAQRNADATFLAAIDKQYGGDRKKASQDVVARGWQAQRQGKMEEAMRRFNQAWLIDRGNAYALWGMGAVVGSIGELRQSVALFAEAEPALAGDLDFAVDHARTMGMAGAEWRDQALLQKAFAAFARLHAQAPQHTMNLQNWAITLFYTGDYAQAWQKIRLAEATPRASELDRSFIAALQEKMPRPQGAR